MWDPCHHAGMRFGAIDGPSGAIFGGVVGEIEFLKVHSVLLFCGWNLFDFLPMILRGLSALCLLLPRIYLYNSEVLFLQLTHVHIPVP